MRISTQSRSYPHFTTTAGILPYSIFASFTTFFFIYASLINFWGTRTSAFTVDTYVDGMINGVVDVPKQRLWLVWLNSPAHDYIQHSYIEGQALVETGQRPQLGTDRNEWRPVGSTTRVTIENREEANILAVLLRWGQPPEYRVVVVDREEGGTAAEVYSAKVFRDRPHRRGDSRSEHYFAIEDGPYVTAEPKIFELPLNEEHLAVLHSAGQASLPPPPEYRLQGPFFYLQQDTSSVWSEFSVGVKKSGHPRDPLDATDSLFLDFSPEKPGQTFVQVEPDPFGNALVSPNSAALMGVGGGDTSSSAGIGEHPLVRVFIPPSAPQNKVRVLFAAWLSGQEWCTGLHPYAVFAIANHQLHQSKASEQVDVYSVLPLPEWNAASGEAVGHYVRTRQGYEFRLGGPAAGEDEDFLHRFLGRNADAAHGGAFTGAMRIAPSHGLYLAGNVLLIKWRIWGSANSNNFHYIRLTHYAVDGSLWTVVGIDKAEWDAETHAEKTHIRWTEEEFEKMQVSEATEMKVVPVLVRGKEIDEVPDYTTKSSSKSKSSSSKSRHSLLGSGKRNFFGFGERFRSHFVTRGKSGEVDVSSNCLVLIALSIANHQVDDAASLVRVYAVYGDRAPTTNSSGQRKEGEPLRRHFFAVVTPPTPFPTSSSTEQRQQLPPSFVGSNGGEVWVLDGVNDSQLLQDLLHPSPGAKPEWSKIPAEFQVSGPFRSELIEAAAEASQSTSSGASAAGMVPGERHIIHFANSSSSGSPVGKVSVIVTLLEVAAGPNSDPRRPLLLRPMIQELTGQRTSASSVGAKREWEVAEKENGLFLYWTLKGGRQAATLVFRHQPAFMRPSDVRHSLVFKISPKARLQFVEPIAKSSYVVRTKEGFVMTLADEEGHPISTTEGPTAAALEKRLKGGPGVVQDEAELWNLFN